MAQPGDPGWKPSPKELAEFPHEAWSNWAGRPTGDEVPLSQWPDGSLKRGGKDQSKDESKEKKR